jgi:hypothetical protein
VSRLNQGTPEPETRVGICCGDACRETSIFESTWEYAPLFKIPGLSRYRCAECFAIEMGHPHHLAPPCTCHADRANVLIGNHFGECFYR